MRLAVIGNVERGIHELMRYGSSIGFEMVHATDTLPHEIASTVHAVIYVVEGAIADAHDTLQTLATTMRQYGVKRLIIHASDPEQHTIDTTDIDWTVIHDAPSETNSASAGRYNQNFAKFVIGQVTNAQHVNNFVAQPTASSAA